MCDVCFVYTHTRVCTDMFFLSDKLNTIGGVCVCGCGTRRGSGSNIAPLRDSSRTTTPSLRCCVARRDTGFAAHAVVLGCGFSCALVRCVSRFLSLKILIIDD